MKKAIQIALFLAIVSGLAGGALAFANSATIDKINENAIAAEKANLVLIYPGTSSFTPVDVADDNGVIDGIYQAGDEGYVYKCSVDGFGGSDSIVFMVGINKDGTYKGFTVLSSGETKGLGSRVGDPEFYDPFVGKGLDTQIDTLSGATVSSTATVKGLSVVKEHFNANFK